MDADNIAGDGGVRRSVRHEPCLRAVLGYKSGEVGRFHIRDRVRVEKFLFPQFYLTVVSLRSQAHSL